MSEWSFAKTVSRKMSIMRPTVIKPLQRMHVCVISIYYRFIDFLNNSRILQPTPYTKNKCKTFTQNCCNRVAFIVANKFRTELIAMVFFLTIVFFTRETLSVLLQNIYCTIYNRLYLSLYLQDFIWSSCLRNDKINIW